ncbi:MAG: hypothetical protein E7624_08420 [Ruminococcaceae bacterium]|nr:hypothetical protein [Oscillospiraceae bacterium]
MNEEQNKNPAETEKSHTVSGVNEENTQNIAPADAPTKKDMQTAENSTDCQQKRQTGARNDDKKEKKRGNPTTYSARTKKRLLIVGITVGVLLLALVGFLIANAIASNRPPEFATVRDRFATLIEASYELNQVIFGEGLPVYKRFEREIKPYTVTFKGKEEKLLYYLITDDEYGTVVSYEYQIQRMEGKVNENGIKIYTVYDVQTGEELPAYQKGAARFVQRSLIEREGYIYSQGKYFYYPIENYENPELVYAEIYSGEEDKNYDYVRFDCKYKSTDDLKSAINSVYSKAYISYIYEVLFTGTVDLRDEVIQALYIDYQDEDGGLSYLMRTNAWWDWRKIPTTVYDLSTMRMDESESNANSVRVLVEGYPEGKENERREYEIWFARENNGWYLDSATY